MNAVERVFGRSPRTRGWSRSTSGRPSWRSVPRVRGGGPDRSWANLGLPKRSPRTRGWSQSGARPPAPRPAFPAYAGVVPPRAAWTALSGCVPRVRGGGPVFQHGRLPDGRRSPRTRGWSRTRPQTKSPVDAFPAYAGVVPGTAETTTTQTSVPRVRGGGPSLVATKISSSTRSPRTRGWSRDEACLASGPVAFPAYAGVVPSSRRRRRRRGRVPRVRGGGPLAAVVGSAPGARSPRTRGWSRDRTVEVQQKNAFPAYAGVVP